MKSDLYSSDKSSAENGACHSRLEHIDKLQYTDPRQAYDLACALCREINEAEHPLALLRAVYLKSRTAWHMGIYDDALFSATELLDKSMHHANPSYQAEAYNMLGNVNLHMDNLDQALEHYREGLKLAKASNNSRAESSLNNNIGEIYNRLDANDQARGYYMKALDIAQATDQPNGIGVAYLNLGELAMKDGNQSKALEYVNDALRVFQNNRDKLGEAYVLYLKADIFAVSGNLDAAEQLYIEAEKIERETGDQYNLMRTGLAYVRLLIQKPDLELAEKKCLGLLDLSEILNSSSSKALALSLLAKIFEHQKDFEKALTFYKRYHDSDLLNQKETLNERLNHVRSQFRIEQAQHEKEIFRLKNVDLKSKNRELMQLYDNIATISKIGRDITSTLNLNDVFARIYTNLNNIMDATFFGISLYDDAKDIITFPLFITNGRKITISEAKAESQNSLSAWCIRNRAEIFINDYLNEYHRYKDDPMEHRHGKLSQSILFVPLIIEDRIIGCITAQSYARDAYTHHHLDMLKALASYTTIAIQNGQESQKLEMEIKRRKHAQKALEALNEKLREMTYIDALTDIPNRRHFVDTLSLELHRSIRDQSPLSVILIDIDKFKEYNDNYGHTAGDTCLTTVAEILGRSLKRKTDFVARYGGDEFVAVLPNTDLKGAHLVAEAMRTSIEAVRLEHAYSSVAPIVSITLGIFSEIPGGGMTLERLVQLADHALYTAKDMGRNCVASNISPLALEAQ